MDRAFQALSSGSYLDAARVDRIVDRLVRKLNGALYASSLAPTHKLPNGHFKENGSALLFNAVHGSATMVLGGAADSFGRLLAIAYRNPTVKLLSVPFAYILLDATVVWRRLGFTLAPGETFLTRAPASVAGSQVSSQVDSSLAASGLQVAVAGTIYHYP